MATFTLAIGDGVKGSGKTYKLQLEGDDCTALLAKRIGDQITLSQTKDNTLVITGGSDSSGFPMRRDVEGTQKKKIFLARGVGYRQKREGCKDRKMVCGNTISEATVQVNLKVVKPGKETLEKIFAPPQEPKQDTESGDTAPKVPAKEDAPAQAKSMAEEKKDEQK